MNTLLKNKKILKSMGLSAGLIAALFATLPAQADLSAEKLANTAAESGVSPEIPVKAEFFDKLGFKAGYKLNVERSFHDGLYTRSDEYNFNVHAGSGNLLSNIAGSGFNLGLGLSNDLEIKFARQFEKSADAYKSIPYFRRNLPFDHERALKAMKVGDYFTMKAKMGVVVGGSLLKTLGPELALDLGAHYLVNGAFQVHTLRLPDDKIRLRLVGLRTNEIGVTAGIGYNGILEIVKIKVVDRKLTDVLDLNPLRLNLNKGTNNLFMVDYVVDLKDQETQQAYDQVMRNATNFKDALSLLIPKGSVERLKNSLIMDIEPLDSISRADQGNSVETARVFRSFKGSMESEYRNKTVKLGMRLIHNIDTKDFSRNEITSEKMDGTKDYFLLNSYNATNESVNLSFFSKAVNTTKMNVVLKTDENFDHPEAKDLVIAVEKRDKVFQNFEYQLAKRQLSRDLPPAIFNQIDFSGWLPNGKNRKNALMQYKFVIHPDAFKLTPNLTKRQIYDRYINYLKTIDINDLIVQRGGGTDLFGSEDVVNKLGPAVENIAKIMAQVLDKTKTGTDHLYALMELRHEDLFLKSGIRFVLELLPQDIEKLKTLVHVNVQMKSESGDDVNYTFGNKKESAIYNWLLKVQNIINDSSAELLLESEKLTMPGNSQGQ